MIPRAALAEGYEISRIIKGGWHLAGDHGPVDPKQALTDMAAFVEAGITTFDCADIYTGVEQLIGDFRRAWPALARHVRVHTKFVPDLSDLAVVDRRYVEAIIDRSLTRLGMERLDLVQFHWWDFTVPGAVETALELDRLRRAGKIAHIGVTNFDVPNLARLLDAGIPILSHQLQYSLVDGRPDRGKAPNRYRLRGDTRHSGPRPGGRRDRRRHQHRPSGGARGDRRPGAGRGRSGGHYGGDRPTTRSPGRRLHARAGPDRPAWPDHEIRTERCERGTRVMSGCVSR
jgi:hypothetical protein